MAPRPLPLKQRFVRNLHVTTSFFEGTPCVLFGRGGTGYPKFRLGGKDAPSIGAHRWAYEQVHGPIPDEMHLDHRCHNASDCGGGKDCWHRRCINPLHTSPATIAENVLAGKGRTAQQLRATHCKYNHPWDEANTGYRPNGGRTCRTCKREEYYRNKKNRNSKA
jgi:hypothetical protein